MSRPPKNNRATSPARVRALDRQLEALEMRKQGYTFDKIAEALGYASESGARKAVTEAVRKLKAEKAKDLRHMENVRLDNLQLAIWGSALKGDLAVIDRLLKIMERRAKLNGLDAVSTFPGDLNKLTDEQLAEMAGIK